jgi:transcriptional regulator with XRE-family HTH domain
MSRRRRRSKSGDADTPAQLEMMTAFGGRVRDLRSVRGWTSEGLAQESSLTVSTVSNVERAVQEPRLSTVLLLIETFDVTPDELLTGINAPRKKPRIPFMGRTR